MNGIADENHVVQIEMDRMLTSAVILRLEGSASGVTFSNDYQSAGLTDMLEVIMQHQDSFVASLGPGAGLIQVMPPTDEEKLSAIACMRHAYESLGLTFARIPVAAGA